MTEADPEGVSPGDRVAGGGDSLPAAGGRAHPETGQAGPSLLRRVLKVLLFPLLIMVNPKIYFPFEEDEEDRPGGQSRRES